VIDRPRTVDLVIVGAGGFARETAAAVQALAATGVGWRLLGFLDDDPTLHGTHRSGLPILGGTEEVAVLGEAAVVICVVHRLGLPAQRYATIVHPAAQVGAGSVLGPGTVLLAGVCLTADVTLGAHVAVMPQTVLTHDNVVEDFATIASGVRLGGGVRLGHGAYLGSGCLIREFVTVGAGSLVGLGSVVLDDVPPGEVWVGNPARFLRSTR
jgi:sugar O-acyltransferase (sialic acid O-acetyltransferase NeuD family)